MICSICTEDAVGGGDGFEGARDAAPKLRGEGGLPLELDKAKHPHSTKALKSHMNPVPPAASLCRSLPQLCVRRVLVRPFLERPPFQTTSIHTTPRLRAMANTASWQKAEDFVDFLGKSPTRASITS